MAGTPGASGDDVTTESDVEFEPASEVDTEDLDNEDFIERLIERGELDYHVPGQYVDDEEGEEDEEEDDEDEDTEDGSKCSV
jgi:regulator of RNase E activity RraB